MVAHHRMLAYHTGPVEEHSLDEYYLEGRALTANLHRDADSEPGFHILLHCIHARSSVEAQFGNKELAAHNCNFPVNGKGP